MAAALKSPTIGSMPSVQAGHPTGQEKEQYRADNESGQYRGSASARYHRGEPSDSRDEPSDNQTERGGEALLGAHTKGGEGSWAAGRVQGED